MAATRRGARRLARRARARRRERRGMPRALAAITRALGVVGQRPRRAPSAGRAVMRRGRSASAARGVARGGCMRSRPG